MKLSLPWTAAAVALSSHLVPSSLAAEADGCYPEGSPFHPDDWTYCQPITETTFMYYTPMEDTVMIGMHVSEGANGWTSLALAGNGGMKGASPIVVRKSDETDEWVAEDRNSFDYVTPDMDEQQDVQLVFAQQDDATGETAWGVVIPQDSCDEPYDYPVEDKKIFMLWAIGSGHSFGYHTARGQFTANLLGPPPEKTDMSQYEYVDLLMPNVTVVRGEPELDPTNPFICTYYDIDELGKEHGFTSEDKVHVVGTQALPQEGNEKFLHHLVINLCEGAPQGGRGEDGQATVTGEYEGGIKHMDVIPACTNMPPGCIQAVAGWAVGAAPLVLPENVGIPFGEGTKWLVMQMHYYNPTLVPDVTDSSGMRFYIEKNPRPIDAGIMGFVTGAATGQVPPLPGGQKDVAMATLYVEPDCTQQWTEPLNVIEVSHHSHFYGSYQDIRVERDGVDLGPMRREYAFDYNHQTGMPPVSALKQLLPGDRIAATCHFDTTRQGLTSDDIVEIGEESNREMCVPTFLYWPKQELGSGHFFTPPSYLSPLWIGDLEWCSSPGTTDEYESLCFEKIYTDVAGFAPFLFTNFGYEGPAVDYPTLCNEGGNQTAVIKAIVPGICPDMCGEGSDEPCSEDILRAWSNGFCQSNCDIFGLSLFPDDSRTEPYDSTNIGCPQTFFATPTPGEPPICESKGSLPVTIELSGETDGGVSEVPPKEDTATGDVATEEAAPESSSARSVLSPLAVLFMLAGSSGVCVFVGC